MDNKRVLGANYEQNACDYLTDNNIQILDRNFRCRIGEVDIIGRDEDALIFFEVKYRKNLSTGYPSEAVDYRKQRKISKVADYYRYAKKIPDNMNIRFDVISIVGDEINWYKNAFPYQGNL